MHSSKNPHNDPPIPIRSLLARQGFVPATLERLGRQQIRGRLWELIYVMAARGCYLSCTDHLSDIELYQWLDENWLEEPAPQTPFEGQWSVRLSPVIACSEKEGTILWLRFYADSEERDQFVADWVPDHEDPQHDRDRFLPEAPAPIEGILEEELAELDADALVEMVDEDDLLGLKAVDDAISANQEDAEPMTDEWHRPIKVLHRQGVRLLPPDEHTEDTITSALWELLHELACRGFYVLHTDHLTDRKLYAALWKDALRVPALLPGRSPTSGWYHDLLDLDCKADEQTWLRCYATEAERDQAQRDKPALKLPPREAPVARRDWRLPRGPVQ
jgi:hypothetical protein